MDSLDALLKVSGLLLPLLWKEGVDRIARRRSGKRIQYVAWHEGQAGLLNPRLQKLKAFLSRRMGRAKVGDAVSQGLRTTQIFLWNSGTEDLSSEDFFPGKPVFLDLSGGEIVSHRILLQTDDLVRIGSSQSHRAQEHELQPRSTQVVVMEFEHWPPGAGLVVEVRYRPTLAIVPRFHIGGPVRGLRERTYIGTLWRVDLSRGSSLRSDLLATRVILWVSAVGFIAVVGALLAHIHAWPITSFNYWAALVTAISLEWILVVWNEKRIQLTKKVCRSLAYWLDIQPTT